MRLLKVFFVGLCGLFLIITLLSLLIPSDVKVSRSVIINDTSSRIMGQLKDIREWHNWHPMFSAADATIKYNENGCDIFYKNKTTHLIFQSVTENSIKFLLKADGENDIQNQIFVNPIQQQNARQVEWRANIKLSWYPWEKFYGIFIDKISGPGYEAALNGLKTHIESAP
ncbi:MAG: hypothetical protein V4556_02120 [Bacteroidota bacterium]